MQSVGVGGLDFWLFMTFSSPPVLLLSDIAAFFKPHLSFHIAFRFILKLLLEHIIPFCPFYSLCLYHPCVNVSKC